MKRIPTTFALICTQIDHRHPILLWTKPTCRRLPQSGVPGEERTDIPSDDGPRYTVHLFPDFAKTLQHIAPSGASVWFPAMEEDHSPPSTLLLDFWYGCVALRAWGQDAFRSYCTNEIFGPEGRTVQHPSVNRDNNKKSSDDASVEKERTRKTTTQGIAGSDMNNILDVMLAFSTRSSIQERCGRKSR